jgi:hypothetical protein
MAPVAPVAQSPAPAYPGGDAPGIASYYRNSALQGYQGGQMVPNSPLQSNAQSGLMMMDDRQQAAQMRGLAGRIDAIRERSQIANPMVPNSPAMTGFVDPQAESDRRMAPLLARDAAMQQNTPANGNTAFANDPNRMTPDQKADLARKSALDTARGGPAADPTGMAARFGGAMGQRATADAEAIQNGQAVRLPDGSVARFTGTPESAREAQNKGKVEREKLRDRSNMNVPQEELDRRKAADAAKKERSDRARAFESENDGLTYKHMDRLERKFILKQKAVREGRNSQEQVDAEMEFERNKMVRRSRGRVSALQGQDQQNAGRPLPLAAEPAKGPNNIPANPPEVAKQSVKTMTEQSPVLKSLKLTPESDLNSTLVAVAGMQPDKMTPDQKYEAALHLHEFMLSQLESGNPAYQVGENAGESGDDPRTSLIGLDALDTKNKDQMVQWFADLHTQANRSNKPANASPFGKALPIRTGA